MPPTGFEPVLDGLQPSASPRLLKWHEIWSQARSRTAYRLGITHHFLLIRTGPASYLALNVLIRDKGELRNFTALSIKLFPHKVCGGRGNRTPIGRVRIEVTQFYATDQIL